MRSNRAPSFLQHPPDVPILDVRSPGEFEQGHIPGARNLPLFDNEERAEIGTIYKQQGREQAVERGLEIVGPKLAGMVRQAKAWAPEGQLRLHCWRGGMRSESVGWLLERAGLAVTLLEGGYKAYRRQVLAELDWAGPLLILGGATGSGKTELLHQLAALGEQVVDLEGMAHHKGSSFGGLGQLPQPSSEHFANRLHQALSRLDPQRPVWVEDESITIGRVHIPEPFWERMKKAPVVVITVPDEERIERLVNDYGEQDHGELVAAFERIQKRLGGQNLKEALAALQEGDYATAARIALRYYDRAYARGIEQRKPSQVLSIDLVPIAREQRPSALIHLYPSNHSQP